MGNMTYEQFVYWCEYWHYTIEEGYRAMCFTANIIGQHFGNRVDYANKISNDDNSSDAFKTLVETLKDDAMLLSILYGKLDSMVFEMLEKHENNNK